MYGTSQYTSNQYTSKQNDNNAPFSAALDNPPPTNPQWNGGTSNQYSPASAPAPSYSQPYAPQTQPPKQNFMSNIFPNNNNHNNQQQQTQTTPFQPVMTSDPRYAGLAADLAQLKGQVVDALKLVGTAQTAEQVDAGEGFVRPFLGDGLGGQLAGTAMNVGTAGYSHWVTNKANKVVKNAKQLEQRICQTLRSQHPEFANWVTRGKSHDRLGSHKAIFTVGPWLDTANDLLCGGGCFDATSWYLVHRLGTVKDGLRELQGNIESLERSISNPSASQGYNANPSYIGGYSGSTPYNGNAYGGNAYGGNTNNGGYGGNAYGGQY